MVGLDGVGGFDGVNFSDGGFVWWWWLDVNWVVMEEDEMICDDNVFVFMSFLCVGERNKMK